MGSYKWSYKSLSLYFSLSFSLYLAWHFFAFMNSDLMFAIPFFLPGSSHSPCL